MRAPTATFERALRLRRTMTLPEVLLWTDLRDRRCAGLRFRRQHPIGPYILDFYCSKKRLAIEVDGAAHDHERQADFDARRDAWLAQQNIKVMRLPARDVLAADGRAAILDTIAAMRDRGEEGFRAVCCPGPLHHPSGGPPPPRRGGGCPVTFI